MESLDIPNVLKFIDLVHNLKHTPRKGWEYCDVGNCEKIAGHMYAMGIMTFLIGNEPNLDRLKCLQLALVHDLAESIVGDITPRDNIHPDVKHKLEDRAMTELTSLVGDEVGNIIYTLYKEYEAKETPEAKFVKDLDRFDLIMSAANYEKRDNTPMKLQEFFDVTDGKFEHPFMQKLVQGLKERREKESLKMVDNNKENSEIVTNNVSSS